MSCASNRGVPCRIRPWTIWLTFCRVRYRCWPRRFADCSGLDGGMVVVQCYLLRRQRRLTWTVARMGPGGKEAVAELVVFLTEHFDSS